MDDGLTSPFSDERYAAAGAGGDEEQAQDDGPMTLDQQIAASLEKQKFHLLKQIALSNKAKGELEAKIKAAEAKAFEKRQRLGEYNALFMSLENANDKAPRQKLGAREAVLQTKRIIERELNKLSKEAAVTEMKLNKAKDKNGHMRAQIDGLRKEHMTFKKLFIAMTEELAAVKSRISTTRKAIEDGYAARDRAQDDMAAAAIELEKEKEVRTREWNEYTAEIDKFNAQGNPEAEEGAGTLTPEEEEALKKKIKRGNMKMAKDRTLLSMAQQKLAAFQEALQTIRSSTGYEDLQDIIDLFNKYEDEKFNKVGAANRMVVEIERLEKDVAEMRQEVKAREASTAVTKAARQTHNTSLETTAAQMEHQLVEVSAASARMMEEVKAVFPVIDFAFYALGSDKAFEVPSASSPSKGGHHAPAGGASSPLRSKTASLKMYTANPATKQDVKSGVTAGTLSQFMGIIENRSADVIQQYAAAHMGGGAAGSRSPSPAPAALLAAEAADTRRGALSPAAMGPSRPTGRLK